ncbi:unnamed protein product, partial [Cyprideis torosa]
YGYGGYHGYGYGGYRGGGGGLSAWVIAFIVILVIVIALIIFCIVKWNRSSSSEQAQESESTKPFSHLSSSGQNEPQKMEENSKGNDFPPPSGPLGFDGLVEGNKVTDVPAGGLPYPEGSSPYPLLVPSHAIGGGGPIGLPYPVANSNSSASPYPLQDSSDGVNPSAPAYPPDLTTGPQYPLPLPPAPPPLSSDPLAPEDSGAPGGKWVRGTSIVPGEVRGTIRVLLSIKDAEQLRDGDILLTYSTDSGWSECMPLLSGLVTEFGGPFSHTAVAAKERAIPCVVGAENACHLFVSGEQVVLDATNGILKAE